MPGKTRKLQQSKQRRQCMLLKRESKQCKRRRCTSRQCRRNHRLTPATRRAVFESLNQPSSLPNDALPPLEEVPIVPAADQETKSPPNPMSKVFEEIRIIVGAMEEAIDCTKYFKRAIESIQTEEGLGPRSMKHEVGSQLRTFASCQAKVMETLQALGQKLVEESMQ